MKSDILNAPKKAAIFANTNNLKTALQTVECLSDFSIETYLVTPKPFNILLPSSCSFVADNEVKNYNQVKNIICNSILATRKNWYLQQFLKLQFASDIDETILILDGDTLFNRDFITQIISQPTLVTSNEKPSIYNSYISSILGYTLDVSFVANCNLFYGPLLRDRFLPLSLILDFIKAKKNNPSLNFSEYQIMGTMLQKLYKISTISSRIFRRGELIGDCNCNGLRLAFAKKRYDIIAFESNHSASFSRKVLAHLALALNYSW